VAERNGMIRTLTRILLKKALTAMRSWPKDVKLSFNLSAHDISSPEGMLRIVDIIQRSGIDAKRIDFEITETAVTSDYEKALQTILMLKALGAGVSLDDFGAGYSSLSHVRSLPLDKIKIDRSFVIDIDTNKISHDIVKSLQMLCADVGIVCVVEGVESAGQVATLTGIGCNCMQGYYFSRPILEKDVAAFFNDGVQDAAPGPRVAASQG
jgi:predicted signal transduction protein with EAL and GGDEF domain